MATVPDQGFAWVIALACFVINFIMAGLARTAGVLFVALIDLYGVSREAATTPFSIRVCVRNMTGPIIGYLGQKYGIRGVTTIGGLVAALGSILCYFAPNIFWITMFWGVIHGLGFGLSTVLHMIAINQYFDKYKASALGLGYSGDCFGTFAFPVIMEHLISKYDIRGTFLILGGIVLNVIPMALLLREPPWITRNKRKRIQKEKASFGQKDLETECHEEGYENEKNNKVCDEKRKELGLLNTINENESFKKENEDCPPLYENISDGPKVLCIRSPVTGQYNKAFQSSETDLCSLNKENEIRCLALRNSRKAYHEPQILVTSDSQSSILSECSNKTFQSSGMSSNNSSVNDFKTLKREDDHAVYLEIRTTRSASDINQRNEFPSSVNKPVQLGNISSEASLSRRESMPIVLQRKPSLKVKRELSRSHENTNTECDELGEMECPRTDCSGTLKKGRTPSFVEQVAHDIVNRVRTASFASQVAQDAFVTPITHEPEADSEQKSECELKSIVEHINHDAENCTNKDLILSIDKNMMDDYFGESLDKQDDVFEVKPETPSMLKLMIRTNTKPMFILISLSMAVYAFLFVSVLTIIIDYAVDLGVPNDRGKYLVIGFSIADLIGRLSFGQVLDRKLMKMKNYSGCTMLIMGTLVSAIPLNVSFNYMMVCMCMYGLIQGGTAIMFPILINMYMEKDSESVAMGCLNFYGGLLMLLMAPMIGFFRDNTGSYNCVFYIIGGAAAIVGIIWQFEPMIVKYQNRKLREKYIMREVNMMHSSQ